MSALLAKRTGFSEPVHGLPEQHASKLSLTMIIALHGYTPTATRNVPPYRTWARLATSSMIYPAIAKMLPAAIMGPLALILSDSSDVINTVTNAAKFGGTVNSCAVVVLVYPRPVMMVGRKREKL